MLILRINEIKKILVERSENMSNSFGSRLKNAWNVFTNQNDINHIGPHQSYTSPQNNRIASVTNERTIMASIINRITMDVCTSTIKQVYTDSEGRYLRDCACNLNRIFNVEANIDQSGYNFMQDIVASMLSEGCIAVVPIDGELKTTNDGFIQFTSMRSGKIIEWYADTIKVDLYNELTGKREQVLVKKRMAAIIENPFYSVMNAPNSTLTRLISKLALLDKQDSSNFSGKMNMIVQLPYAIKSQARKIEAEQRLGSIQQQLNDSTYGIAYMDATEKIIQLNRPLDNNLVVQIQYLTDMLYNHIGMTQSIIDGTANESTMLNYTNRVINTILDTIVSELSRKYISETARTQGQTVMYFRDPFKTMPVSAIAESGDKLTRNEILSSNEIRQKIGMKPSKDPRADQLINKNISAEAPSINKTDEPPE